MKLSILRTRQVPDPPDTAVEGSITTLDGPRLYFAWTLERLAVLFPAGEYPLKLTPSNRAKSGSLYTPFDDPKSELSHELSYAHHLPEVLNVPGRSGIRCHALNEAKQSEGCVGVGKQRTATQIVQSRLALEELCALLVRCERDGEAVTLEVKEQYLPTPGPTIR